MSLKKIVYLSLLMLISFTLYACGDEAKHIIKNVEIEGPTLTYNDINNEYETKSDITLPQTINKFDITWDSNDETTITISGVVTRPENQEDKTVILTASIGKYSKEFLIIVKNLVVTEEDKLLNAKNQANDELTNYIEYDKFNEKQVVELKKQIDSYNKKINNLKTIEEVEIKLSEYLVEIDNILKVFATHKDGISAINNISNFDKYETNVKDFLTSVKDNYINSISTTTTNDSYNKILTKATKTIKGLIKLADGNKLEEVDKDNFDFKILEETNLFDGLTAPEIIGLPEKFVVDRGFTGDLLHEFDVKVISVTGEDTTSLTEIIGDYDFTKTGNYSVKIKGYDGSDRFSETDNIVLEVEAIDIKPIIEISTNTRVVKNQGELSLEQVKELLLQGVFATDGIGLDITNNINITLETYNEENVLLEDFIPNVYKVVYNVVDMDGNTETILTHIDESDNKSEFEYLEITYLSPTESWRTDITEQLATEPGLLYLMIDDIVGWELSNDDLYTGVSDIPIQPRVENAPAINKDVKSLEAGVALLDVFQPVTAANTYVHKGFDTYTVDYWQYVDIAVAWGGQIASFVVPSKQITNAAHKNGVPILGNVFMAPTAFGGTVGNTRKMLRKSVDENGETIFPVADKMLEIADHFKFDGWFMNMETDLPEAMPDIAVDYRDFLSYMKAQIALKYPGMIIQNYDSMSNDGQIRWQGTLNENNDMFFGDSNNIVSDLLFIDFRWDGRYDGNRSQNNIKEAAEHAISLGRNPYDLYTGFDTQQFGYDKSSSTATPWANDRYFDKNGVPYTSFGIYRADWQFNLDGNDKIEGKIPNDYNSYIKTAQEFWLGFKNVEDGLDKDGNPKYKRVANTDPRDSKVDLEHPTLWYGPAAFVAERTNVQGDSFHTNFNTGNGLNYFVGGVKSSRFKNGWNNLELADIQPHFRWVRDTNTEGTTPLDIEFDYTDAYNSGSSLKISGDLNKDNSTDFTIYKTYLDFDENSVINITYKTNNNDVDVKLRLTFESGEEWYTDINYASLNNSVENSWINESINLDSLSSKFGEKITTIGFKVSTDSLDIIEDYKLNVGSFSISKPSNVTLDNNELDFEIEEVGFSHAMEANAKLSWTKGEEGSKYTIYQETKDGDMFLGATYGNHLYIEQILREVLNKGELVSDYAEEFTLVVKETNYLGDLLSTAKLSYNWPDPIAGGRIDIHASKVIIKADEEITLTARTTSITDSVEWIIEGAELTNNSKLTDEVVTVKFNKQGIYSVKLITKNALGENELEVKYAITVSNAAATVSNLARGGRIREYSGFVNNQEHPRMLIDGNYRTKWAESDATTPGDKWVVIDLGGIYNVSEIKLFHASYAGVHENDTNWNTGAYDLYYQTEFNQSSENTEWIYLDGITGNHSKLTNHAFAPIEMRYVLLVITEGSIGVDNHARVQEIEIMGRA